MIISHKHKYIFIKVSKTAGSSIQTALQRYNSPGDICIGKPGSGPRFGMDGHAYAQLIELVFPTEWKNYFKFGYTRNPWDRMVSSYCFRNKGRINWGQDFSAIREGFLREINGIGQEFIKERHHLMNPFRAISLNDEVAVDFVCRFENLNGDLTAACKKIGVSYDGNLPKVLTKQRRDKRHYSHWYDNETRDLVASFFPKTIETFKYVFEDQREK